MYPLQLSVGLRVRRIAIMAACLKAFHFMSGISECSSGDADGDGYTTQDGDCDDSDSSIYPYAPERCDGIDSNCYDLDEPYRLFYLDQDHDGWGDIAQSVEGCQQPSGTNARAGDCDDTDDSRYPTHVETCNGKDDDCNGIEDDGLGDRYYRDADGDGFGSLLGWSCGAKSGYITVRGDCDDARKDVYPGASDASGDGRDQDCGGFDGPQPQLGFGKNPASSLQTALDSAPDGGVVWVGPGEFAVVNVQFPARSLRLMSTHGRESTILNAQKQGRVFAITSGNTAETEIDGFTLKNGLTSGQDGGAVLVLNSSPTLRQLAFDSNQALSISSQTYAGRGGALALESSNSFISDVRFSNNSSLPLSPADDVHGGYGGALFIVGGEPRISGINATDNYAYQGGALYGLQTDVELRSSQFTRNDTENRGLSLYLFSSILELYDTAISEHDIYDRDAVYAQLSEVTVAAMRYANNASAFHVDDGVARVTDSAFVDNQDTALFMTVGWQVNGEGYPPSLVKNTQFRSNIGDESKGVAALRLDGFASVEFNTFVGNSYRSVGAIYLQSGTAQLDSNLFAYNVGYDLDYYPNRAALPYLTYNNFYNLTSDISPQPIEMDTSNTRLEPRLVAWSNDDNAANDDLHLLPDSPILDAGNPAIPDNDGSRAQVGAYGADALADGYAQDADADGMYDGWEKQHGLNTGLNDGGADLDSDGVKNQLEFMRSLDPSRADTDADGQKDGIELSAGSDAADWYQRAATSGSGTVTVTARVPGDFASLQDAIRAIRLKGDISLAAGNWAGPVRVLNKTVGIQGDWGATLINLTGESATLLESRAATLSVTGLDVSGGYSNSAPGGFWFGDSTVYLTDVNLLDNVGTTFGTAGYAERSILSFQHVHFEGNFCDDVTPTFEIDYSSLQFEGLTFLNNSSAGLLARYSAVEGQFLNVQGQQNGSGLVTTHGDARIHYCRITYNHAGENAGGIESVESNLTLTHCVLVGNDSDRDASIRIEGNPTNTFTLDHSIVAYNSNSNIVVIGPVASVSYSNVYNPSGMENMTGVPPSNTLTSVEPRFLAYDGSGLPTDFHLAFDSPLINAGAVGQTDVDGSRADLGIYGGADGELWDRDSDTYEDYFWPGTRAQAPKGFTASDWDLNDGDATVH